MGLKITSLEEHKSGNVSTTYLHISEYHKQKEDDTILVGVRYYTSKARRDSDVKNTSRPLSITEEQVVLDMTMAEFSAAEDTVATIYALLKTYTEDSGGLDRTVENEV